MIVHYKLLVVIAGFNCFEIVSPPTPGVGKPSHGRPVGVQVFGMTAVFFCPQIGGFACTKFVCKLQIKMIHFFDTCLVLKIIRNT